MAEDELENIKKLPPEERIAKLKELEEKRKKEIEKAKELVKASIEEITKEEENKFAKEESLKEEIRQIRESFEETLEETIAKEEPKAAKEQLESHRDYIRHLREDVTVRDLYSLAKNLAQNVEERGYLSNIQQEMLNDLERVQQYKQNDINSGKYKVASEEILDVLSATKSLLNVLKERYSR